MIKRVDMLFPQTSNQHFKVSPFDHMVSEHRNFKRNDIFFSRAGSIGNIRQNRKLVIESYFRLYRI